MLGWIPLVDVDENGAYSDLVISNNNDMPKVLATVAQTLVAFFRLRPTSSVIFRGSTPSRTRLYRMAIAKSFDRP
ncbi:DUF6934 family protein [Nibrella viscosa]|uniref:DUF6934 family protein n=1 Tax=Nibrella viscosa TaxID=1084524 RepID=UPI003F80CB78